LLGYQWQRYMLRLLPVYAAALGVAILSYTCTVYLPTRTLIHLFFQGVGISLAYVLVVYQVGLATEEKDQVNKLLERFLPWMEKRV
jgi:hypothetical protein